MMRTSIQTEYSRSVDAANKDTAVERGLAAPIVLDSQRTLPQAADANFAGYEGAPRLAARQDSEQN